MLLTSKFPPLFFLVKLALYGTNGVGALWQKGSPSSRGRSRRGLQQSRALLTFFPMSYAPFPSSR